MAMKRLRIGAAFFNDEPIDHPDHINPGDRLVFDEQDRRLRIEEPMSDETYEIRWTVDYSARLTREQIAEVAISPDGVTDEYREACREWLAANPKGLTRDEFNALPDGSVVRTRHDTQLVKVGVVGGYTDSYGKVRWVSLSDHELEGLSVVSTPPAPTLDDVDVVLSDAGWIWKHDGYGWQRLVPDGRQFRSVPTCELENQVGPLTPLLPGPQIGGEA